MRRSPIWDPTPAVPSRHAATKTLTRREREILALLRHRRTNREIAETLSISIRTAEAHVGNILGKLGAANRREAAALALRSRLWDRLG